MNEPERHKSFKARDIGASRRPSWRAYADLVVGEGGLLALLRYELVVGVLGTVPGALGLALRKAFYPSVLGSVGRNVVFGRNVVIRHGGKIHIGSGVIVDDGCVLDAKGDGGSRILIGGGVFVGRNTIVYTKGGGVVELGDDVNVGANCTLYAKNRLSVGAGTLIAAYCHLMSGGQYDYRSATPLHEQDSVSRGPTTIGPGCWLGSKVVVQDNVSVGAGTVIGTGAVVTEDVPAEAVAMGVPARVRAERRARPGRPELVGGT